MKTATPPERERRNETEARRQLREELFAPWSDDFVSTVGAVPVEMARGDASRRRGREEATAAPPPEPRP